MKCFNCKQNKQGEKFYKYQNQKYCYSCLREHFIDELIENAFENFLYEECEEI